jgi:septation ring formation regulator EzrA
MNQGTIIALCIVGGVLLVGVLVLLYFTVFKHARLRKQCRDYCGKFERSHALLFGQDSQFIKRLETIASMNLTFVEDYMEWNKKFKDIRDVSDASAQAAVNTIQDYLSDRKYKELQTSLPGLKDSISTYEKQVNTLDLALKRKFQDEEDCRQLSYAEREKLRKIKQDYFTKQGDLVLASSSFDTVFKKMNNLFDQVEQNIENAQYIDAKTILRNEIAPVNEEIARILKNLPNICISIQSVIPDKLSSLNNRYEEMSKAGYPLYHILSKDDISNMDQELSVLAQRVRDFDTKDVDKILDSMTRKIDSYNEAFNKEKEARTTFENECDKIYHEENLLESQFIGLCHSLPDIKRIFSIGSDEQAKIDAIQIEINKAGASRRSLDTYVHSVTKQPYSILVDKMRTLSNQTEEGDAAIKEFQNYLRSLKVDSDTAAKAIPLYEKRLQAATKTVREIGIDAVHAKFDNQFDQISDAIDTLYKDITAKPIDVKKVNDDLAVLKSNGEATLNDVSDTYNTSIKAENAIILANNHRTSSAEVNSLLTQAEGLFLKGDFHEAYDTALSATHHYHEGQ